LDNPYAPPRAEVERAQPPGPVAHYTPGQVGFATFLGTVLAGGLLLSANDRASGNPGRARQTLLLGIGFTVATFVVAFFLPDNFPNIVIPLATTFAMRSWAQQRRAEWVRQHGEPEKQSAWRALGIGVLCLVLMVVLIFGSAALSDSLAL